MSFSAAWCFTGGEEFQRVGRTIFIKYKCFFFYNVNNLNPDLQNFAFFLPSYNTLKKNIY